MHKSGLDYTMYILCGLSLIFLALPLLMIFPLSIDSRDIISFPPKDLTFKWYLEYLSSGPWIGSTLLSIFIALGAAIIATLIGTPAAVGLVYGNFRFKRVLSLLLVSPLLLPLIVIAISIYGIYATFGMVGSPFGLVIAHAILGLPFVIINVASVLTAIPQSLDDAARSLGARPIVALFTVVLPLAWRGIAAGAIFAFVVSFDEVVVALFISGSGAITLPRRLMDGIFYDLSPIIAAVSACLLLFNIIFAVIGLSLSKRRKIDA